MYPIVLLQDRTPHYSSQSLATSCLTCPDIPLMSSRHFSASPVGRKTAKMILRLSATRYFSPCIVVVVVTKPNIQCDSPYHLGCLKPPLSSVPDGEWFCVDCKSDPGAPIGPHAVRKGRTKAKAKHIDSSPPPDVEAGGKRKAPTKAKSGGTSFLHEIARVFLTRLSLASKKKKQ